MNILVIGAKGRVGQRLIEILLAKGHHVIGTTQNYPTHQYIIPHSTMKLNWT